MFIQYFFTDSLSHISYMLIAGDEAFVIDPKRDIQDYLDEAYKRNIQITGVLLTHPHADFVAGHLELERATGAKIYAHKESPFSFDFIPIDNGFTINLNHVQIKVIETPGHTPFDISFLVKDLSRGDDPICIFTGDTLFVGDVGRPDLFPGQQEILAHKLFQSLQKLKELPDFVEIYPAHAAGTLCGKKLAEKRTSTIGFEKRHNSMLKITNEHQFVKKLLTNLPPVPRHFRRCANINSGNITFLEKLNPAKIIDYTTFEEKQKKAYIIDIRSHLSWVGLHMPQTISLDYDCLPLSVYAGWLLEPDKEIILITDRETDLNNLAIQFRRVGLDQPVYVLEKGLNQFLAHHQKAETEKMVYADELPDMIEKGAILIDVRSEAEPAVNIKNYRHIPLMQLEDKIADLDASKKYIIMCQMGVSAVVAASIIKYNRHMDIQILAGGLQTVKNLNL